MSNRRGKKRGASLVMSVLALVFVMVAVTQAGQSGIDPRIFNGTEAEFGQFPFLASLFVTNEDRMEYKCGGSVIDEHHILTAAQCIPNPAKHGLVASIGCHDLSKCENNYKISTFLIHPDYFSSSENDSTLQADIAILRTEKPINFQAPTNGHAIESIWLPKADDSFGDEKLKVVGRGGTGDSPQYYTDSPIKAELPVIRLDNCKKHFPQAGRQHICAGSEWYHVCAGDIGSPLFRTFYRDENDRPKVLIGIVSSEGSGSCGKHSVGLHTRVKSHVDWIEYSISYSKLW